MKQEPPKLIVPDQPKLIVPGQQPQPPETPMATMQQVLSMFANFCEFVCDDAGSDNIEFELKGSDGTPAIIHFSRGDTSKLFKKWINKAKKRLDEKPEEQALVVPLFKGKE